jgi:hypothetical protein
MIFYKSSGGSSYISYPEVWDPDECVFLSNYSNTITVMDRSNVDKFLTISHQRYFKTTKKDFEDAYLKLLEKINKKFH